MNWINVKDKLPEAETLILVYCSDEEHGIDIASYDLDQWSKDHGFEQKNKWWFHDGWLPFESVIYWMPLPEIPEEYKQKNKN